MIGRPRAETDEERGGTAVPKNEQRASKWICLVRLAIVTHQAVDANARIDQLDTHEQTLVSRELVHHARSRRLVPPSRER